MQEVTSWTAVLGLFIVLHTHTCLLTQFACYPADATGLQLPIPYDKILPSEHALTAVAHLHSLYVSILTRPYAEQIVLCFDNFSLLCSQV